VTQRRTSVDFAYQLKHLVAIYPEAEQIVLVTDNLNTHNPASLCEAFAPEEARRIAAKIEWHYAPEHGSWLNMAETELSVLSRQCLNRRIADAETLAQEVAAWQQARDRAQTPIRWQFTTKDARIKLWRLYPKHKKSI
jgi:transposase